MFDISVWAAPQSPMLMYYGDGCRVHLQYFKGIMFISIVSSIAFKFFIHVCGIRIRVRVLYARACMRD